MDWYTSCIVSFHDCHKTTPLCATARQRVVEAAGVALDEEDLVDAINDALEAANDERDMREVVKIAARVAVNAAKGRP